MVAPVAQLDRASASGVEGHEFESRRVYHFFSAEPRKFMTSAVFLPHADAVPAESAEIAPRFHWPEGKGKDMNALEPAVGFEPTT